MWLNRTPHHRSSAWTSRNSSLQLKSWLEKWNPERTMSQHAILDATRQAPRVIFPSKYFTQVPSHRPICFISLIKTQLLYACLYVSFFFFLFESAQWRSSTTGWDTQWGQRGGSGHGPLKCKPFPHAPRTVGWLMFPVFNSKSQREWAETIWSKGDAYFHSILVPCMSGKCAPHQSRMGWMLGQWGFKDNQPYIVL